MYLMFTFTVALPFKLRWIEECGLLGSESPRMVEIIKKKEIVTIWKLNIESSKPQYLVRLYGHI